MFFWCVERAELLFDIISTAYQQQSLLVTTNLPLGSLGCERLPVAALDRRTHRCYILETTGESCRLKAARQISRSKTKG
ncbi:MAG: ATP-binding protein [Planctomycetes bacterium]|nr:ATP-binding protein [Planctomycetota bacterium]